MSESRVHHLACGTSDVQRLARFYSEVLGLPEVARHVERNGELRSVWLDLGDSLLMLESTPHTRERLAGVGPGLFLLALRVTPEARSALERRLIEAGCEIESRSEWSSYSRDPDGNRIALSHYPLPPVSSAGSSSGR